MDVNGDLRMRCLQTRLCLQPGRRSHVGVAAGARLRRREEGVRALCPRVSRSDSAGDRHGRRIAVHALRTLNRPRWKLKIGRNMAMTIPPMTMPRNR